MFAGMLFTSGVLLLYTAVIAPIQMLMWDPGNQCKMFPTLYIDVLVDLFFMVVLVTKLKISILFCFGINQ
jgi:hypothetical protein